MSASTTYASSGVGKLALAGDAYTNCPNGRTLEQEERSVLA
jgi:hypothetical protein